MSLAKLLAVGILCLVGFGGRVGIAAEGGPATADKAIQSAWVDLREEEPAATRAILVLAKTPQATTAFLAGRLKPLILTQERLDELLVQLGSKDLEQAKAASHELEYFDPRLTMDLDEVMEHEAVQKSPARDRLVDVLSGGSFEDANSVTSRHYKSITLESFRAEKEAYYNFRGTHGNPSEAGAWWAEPKVERLNTRTKKPEWTRLVRALVLLESFGSDEAVAVIRTMASGHADAQPTKVAKQILERLGKQ